MTPELRNQTWILVRNGRRLQTVEAQTKAEAARMARSLYPRSTSIEVRPDETASRRRDRPVSKVRTCRVCGCTDSDCEQCIERTGEPCYWVEFDLCSACRDNPPASPGRRRREARHAHGR